MRLISAVTLGSLLSMACSGDPSELDDNLDATGGATETGSGGIAAPGSGGDAAEGSGGMHMGTGGQVGTGGQIGTGGADVSTGGVDAGSGGATTGSGGSIPVEENFLVHATFQSQSVGAYARADVAADFGVAAPWDNGLSQGRAAIVEEESNRFMRVTYPANQYGPNDGGVQFEVALGESYDELFFSYKVRFANGFNFMKGGKLPGLVGGSSPSGCTTDKVGGFSARNMWRTGGDVDQYLYYPDRQNNCGDDWYYKDGSTTLQFQPGTWHTIEHRLIMGTAGQTDGLLEAWFDGELALSRGLRWKVSGASYGIDALYFSTFFGGGDSSWAPPSSQQADFDDFIVSESPITH